jgi:Ca-activated chloride channel family protein
MPLPNEAGPSRHRFRRTIAALLVLLFVLISADRVAGTFGRAQQDFRLRRTADLVCLEVTVTDRRGEFVAGLTRENFRVLDEGSPQAITHFSAIEAPAQILLVVETSPAVYLVHRQHLVASGALLAGLAPDDQVALAAYDERLHPLVGFSADRRTLAAALAGLRYNLGTTVLNLSGSLGAAIEQLDALPGRRAVVLLSTGLDTGPPELREALWQRLRATEAVIYAIALGGDLREHRQPASRENAPAAAALSFEDADRLLRRLAEESGGQVFFPKRAEEFEGIYRGVASALRHQYSLGFPPAARDGQFRRVEVQVTDDRGRLLAPGRRARYRVHHRAGYLAPDGVE